MKKAFLALSIVSILLAFSNGFFLFRYSQQMKSDISELQDIVLGERLANGRSYYSLDWRINSLQDDVSRLEDVVGSRRYEPLEMRLCLEKDQQAQPQGNPSLGKRVSCLENTVFGKRDPPLETSPRFGGLESHVELLQRNVGWLVDELFRLKLRVR